MLDVGTHCTFCRQLDFLPFHCKFCEGDFCGSHRSQEAHRCPKILKESSAAGNTTKSGEPVRNSNGEYFSTLLPEKAHIRVKQAVEAPSVAKGNNSSVRSRLEASGNRSALEKLKSFFGRRSGSKAGSLTKARPANRIIEVAKLKKTAKGDPKIPVVNRVYVFCFSVEAQDENVKHELFINKVWPVGRALDYIASQLAVRNVNNHVQSSDKERLFLYCDKNGTPSNLDTASRIANIIKDGDTLYLVRGEDVPNV